MFLTGGPGRRRRAVRPPNADAVFSRYIIYLASFHTVTTFLRDAEKFNRAKTI